MALPPGNLSDSTHGSTRVHRKLQPVADLRGGAQGTRPPPGPKFFQFHTVFGKIWHNRMLAPPPRELAPPPRGNPGSATANSS